MTPDELREAVAREIKRTRLRGAAAQADAAISTVLAALEEPTEGMMVIGVDAFYDLDPDDVGARQIIRHILSAMFSQLRKELTNGH